MELAACKKYVKLYYKYQLPILYNVSQVLIDENISMIHHLPTFRDNILEFSTLNSHPYAIKDISVV